MNIYCPKCGKENLEEASICVDCKSQLREKKHSIVTKNEFRPFEEGELGRLHLMAQKSAEAGDLKKAIELYSTLLERKPIFEAICNRGVCYSRINDNDKALADFSWAIELEPQQPGLYVILNNRGYIYQTNNDYTNALADYNSSIRLNPRYPDAYFNRAEVFRELGQNTEAIDSYNSFLRIAPHSPVYKRLIEDAHRNISQMEGKEKHQNLTVPPGYEKEFEILFGGGNTPLPQSNKKKWWQFWK